MGKLIPKTRIKLSLEMKTQVFCLVVLLALTAVAKSDSLKSTVGIWNKLDTSVAQKLFKFMLMVPTNKAELSAPALHSDYKQANILESEVHPTDLAGSLIEDFLVKGGKSKSAHIISASQDLASAFKNYMVGFKPNNASQKIDLIHRGRKVSALKTSGLASCLEKNPALGAKLSRSETGEVTLSVGPAQMTFSQAQFRPYKTFLKDVCYLLEYAKLHYKDSNNNALIYHLESYLSVVNSLHKDAFMKVLNNALGSFKEIISRTFGNNQVDFLVSMFAQAETGSVPRLDHSRVLEGEADDGNTDVAAGTDTSNEDFGYSIQVITGVLFIFLFLYVCVYIYDMNVYKDDLVYSTLLSTKKR